MPAASPSDRKRKPNRRRQTLTASPSEDDENNDEDMEDDPHAQPQALADPVLRCPEVLSDGGLKISDFPPVYKRTVNRPHPSVVAIVAAERGNSGDWVPPGLENVSHGQLQALSAVPRDHVSLVEGDRAAAYVCTPPVLMEGKGVKKRFLGDRVLVVPAHADWFAATRVHRLERQVVPHFFNGKSSEHTPERYVAIRNKIIGKYLENTGKRLSLAECQGLVPKEELYDLSRIVRFLDHWGIINYLATSSVHRGLRLAGSLLREDAGGELQLQTSPLKSIDSLILFDRPKCSVRPEDVGHMHAASSSSAPVECDGLLDLDSRIRERLAENVCNYCSKPLPQLHYQSQKEADVMICVDCFHDAKFVTGHSSLDFIRVDSKKDSPDFDVDSWTDEETLLLLEAIEKHGDNWNDIAEYVGTKSKAQCLLHFIRLPVEDGLLENIEIPKIAPSSNGLDGHYEEYPNSNSNSNGEASADHQVLNHGSQIPFANSVNPVMSLVAFLTSKIGPRVAASCANAALTVLTNGDSIASDLGLGSGRAGVQGPLANLGHQKDGTISLTPELVKHAALCGLSDAAMKVKLFADQEEREIQRLAATVINHQLKRLELKLKQFAEIETLLLKESEQAERMRQRLAAERVRMMSIQFGQPGNSAQVSGGAAAVSAATVGSGIRPCTGVQPSMSAAFSNNVAGRPQMPSVQRPPQQMFSFGPRLPFSAINPAGPQSAMFSTGMANSSAANHHPFLRSSSGNNQNVG